ncbi:hypothetical protein Pcinc_035767 [Petrolisthes cinctipes]|uniref:Sushi/von Willebrand factor type A/EGF/pentraxin domain-containing 1 n=1 Tax=Petrolisthes cinctipes TaxID=88211 RepID=A0AAE1EN96_PETCI|nr:hypothetical protein Pcinc_035767 [Petrolisthes cinctipes]
MEIVGWYNVNADNNNKKMNTVHSPTITSNPSTSTSNNLNLKSDSLTCGGNGKWAGTLAVCATNVAYKKPVNQSSTSRGGKGENANDGLTTTIHDNKHCTETLVEASPWWAVDLLRPYQVAVVRITTRGCCDQEPLQNIEVRVGDSTNIQRNPLCTWFPGTIEEGVTKDLTCARPLSGRHVFIQMVGTEGSLSLCEVQVFSTQEFSRERCTDKSQLSSLTIFNQTCYELQTTEGGDFERGRAYCQERGGDLAHTTSLATHRFLTSELDRRKEDMKTNLVWIGAQKEPQFVSRTWRWVDGTVVEDPLWGREQPNNYNGQQNCAVLDGGRGWRWNDVGCDLNYLLWICQFSPRSCGSPDRKENTTIMGTERGMGSEVTYKCPEGHLVLGLPSRSCLSSGAWSGEAPTCKYVDCGQPGEIEHGNRVLTDSRTTHGAQVVYECEGNYTLQGEHTLTCSDDGNWTPSPVPQCLFSWCPEIESPSNGEVEISGRRSGDTATFTCLPGHYLQGAKTLTCELGGQWSAEAPNCVFVECGQPETLLHGEITLVNGTTHLGSVAMYECDPDFQLVGNTQRSCLDDGHWSDPSPQCALIECGEPSVPEGGYVTGYSFEVHSEVMYHCEPGHYLVGEQVRLCTRDARWSGHSPNCVYVDCNRVPVVSRGKVIYHNESTHLGSVLEYTCSSNFRLDGEKLRECKRDGKWSGEAARCVEVRCEEPEKPDLSKISITGNDRRVTTTIANRREHVALDNTYRVGSHVTYKCDRGYVVEGLASRVCLANGTWSGLAPKCAYVDCGLPEAINPGTFRLLSNTTHYGSQVSYECGENWKIEGRIRRYCQSNGTWVGEPPKCIEVLCPELTSDLTEWLEVDEGDLRVGTVAVYRCQVGRELVGKAERECRTHGIWSGFQPRCEIVSCSLPDEIPNGRVVRLNESLEYSAVVEYHCLPKFVLRGPFHRSCQANATWSGITPHCQVDEGAGILTDNTVDGTINSARGGGGGDGTAATEPGYTGLWAGLGVGLVGAALVALVCVLLRARQRQGGKETETNSSVAGGVGDKSVSHPASEIISYSNLSDPTTGNNIYENIVEDDEYADMSTGHTYSNPDDNHHNNYYNNYNHHASQPTYTNEIVKVIK